MSARDVVYEFVSKPRSFLGSGAEADALVEALTAAGYRILGPDELDPVTVERSTQEAERTGNFGDYQRNELTAEYGQPRFDMMRDIITAIRSLSPEAPHREAKEARE